MLMLISRNLMLSVIFFVIVVFLGALIFLIARAYFSNKRVKEAERAHEMLFLAKVKAQQYEKELEEKGLTRGAIVYKPETHISDYAQRPFSLRHESANEVSASFIDDAPQIPEEAPPTRKLSEFFD